VAHNPFPVDRRPIPLPVPRRRDDARGPVDDDMDFFLGLAVAVPVGLILWAAIAWFSWRLIA
jgi:hypothetical protein